MVVDTATSLLFAYLAREATQQTVVQGLEHFGATYGQVLSIASDDGTHFPEKELQSWAKTQDVAWQFHIPYCPQAAGIIEWYNGLLKDKFCLGVDTPSLKSWAS